MRTRLSTLGRMLILSAFVFCGLGAAPVHAANPGTYAVQRGDTLIGIATRHGLRVSQLARANGLRWNSWVYVGQRLTIPGSQAPPEAYYVVQRTDTLYRVARRYGTTVQAIMTANSLRSTVIRVGQRLLVPGSRPPTDGNYVVRRGDTLYRIARRYGTTVQAIMAANNLRSMVIHVGRLLVIPGHDSEPVPPSTWESYANPDYEFAFHYPASWRLEETPNPVKLIQGKLRLAIAFHRQGQDVSPPWTGMPAGDFRSRGTMLFLDHEIDKNSLVYEGRVKVLTYAAQVGDLVFSIRLDDMVSADYGSVEIAEAMQIEVDRIVGSFERR